jgi:hypothetical protein
VFCVDEKTAIQALDRLDSVLPLASAPTGGPQYRIPPERHSVAVCRTGCENWYVQGKTAERHTSAALIDFLEQLVSTCKRGRRSITLMMYRFTRRPSHRVSERNPNVKLHFTPTYACLVESG